MQLLNTPLCDLLASVLKCSYNDFNIWYNLFYLNILNTYFFKQMGNIIYNSQQEM